MRNILMVLLLSVSGLLALDGEEVFKNKCASCHMETSMMGKSSVNMKAPSMNIISMRIKKVKGSKENFIAFVKDYIQNPSEEKGVCMPMAFKRFGTMPAIGKSMSEEERELVSQWLYDNFEGSWDGTEDARVCEKKNAGSKCGGSKKQGMKCGAGKCGSK